MNACMKLFAGPSRNVPLVALLVMTQPGQSIADDGNDVKPPAGEYIVAAIRRSSTVESTADSEPNIGDQFGTSISFGEQLVWIDGTRCDSWSARESDEIRMNLYDANLSDLAITPLDSPDVDVFADVVSFDILCEDLAMIGNVIRVDDRVLATLSPGGAHNLILEKPLTTGQVERFQTKLAEMKFYSGNITGNLDTETRAAVAAYADYRGAEYVFRDVVVTRNLLDGLGVLETTE